MNDFVNYTQILLDLQAAVIAAELGFEQVKVNAGDRDYVTMNAPLLDLRIKRAVPQAITNTDYYTDVTIEAEIFCFNVTSRLKAAKLRDDLTNALQYFVAKHPRFSARLDTTIVGQADFGTAESKTDGAFVAGAILEFHAMYQTE